MDENMARNIVMDGAEGVLRDQRVLNTIFLITVSYSFDLTFSFHYPLVDLIFVDVIQLDLI